MKFLRKFMDKIKPNFQEGGKLAKLESVYDGMETFLFTPNTTSRSGVHIHDSNDMKRTMITVVVALLPCLLFAMYNIGYQHFRAIGVADATFWQMFLFGLLAMLPVIVVSYAVGLGIEFIGAQIHHKEIQEGFLVTGILIPLIVPINTPLWMTAVATAFAVIFAKEIFGGTGMNIFNVALITRAFLFFAYPSKMSGDAAFVKLDSAFGFGGGNVVNGFSGATPLGQVAINVGDKLTIDTTTMDAFIGLIPGSPGETSMIAILIGAAIRHSLVESDVERLRRRIGDGSVGPRSGNPHLPRIDARPSGAVVLWRLRLCRCVHGNRPSDWRPHQDRPVCLRIPHRCVCHPHPCLQWRLSRGGDARRIADERLCAAHRLLCCSSQY